MALGKRQCSCGGTVLDNLRNTLFSSEVLKDGVDGPAATSVTLQTYLVVVCIWWWYVFVCCDAEIVLQELFMF